MQRSIAATKSAAEKQIVAFIGDAITQWLLRPAKASTILIGDELNQSLCEVARERFEVPTTIMRLCLLSGVTSWAKLTDGGMARMQWAEVVRTAIGDASPGTLLARFAKLTERDQIVDLELQSPVLVGRKIADLPLNNCEVLALTRNGNSLVEFGSLELRMNDVFTLVGRGPALKRIQESLASL